MGTLKFEMKLMLLAMVVGALLTFLASPARAGLFDNDDSSEVNQTVDQSVDQNVDVENRSTNINTTSSRAYGGNADAESDSRSAAISGSHSSGGDARSTAFGGKGGNAYASGGEGGRSTAITGPSTAITGPSYSKSGAEVGDTSATGGAATGGAASSVGTVTTTTTVEGDKIKFEAPDVKGAAVEAGKALVRYGEGHAESAPDPARALATGCDTAGATAQTGAAGGGFSAPTYPCEVMRTKQALATLTRIEGDEVVFNSGYDRWVTRPLLHVRLFFKGVWSVLPIIGN